MVKEVFDRYEIQILSSGNAMGRESIRYSGSIMNKQTRKVFFTKDCKTKKEAIKLTRGLVRHII